jgi:hypothetical protein
MTAASDLQAQCDALTAELARRDRADVEAKAAALAAENATADAKASAARLEAAAAERETIRRGSWASHLIAAADQKAPLDFAEIDKRIPAQGFPPGVDEKQFGFSIPKDATVDVATTSMGKALAALTHHI